MTIRKFITFLKNFQENKGALNYILYHKDMVQIVICSPNLHKKIYFENFDSIVAENDRVIA